MSEKQFKTMADAVAHYGALGFVTVDFTLTPGLKEERVMRKMGRGVDRETAPTVGIVRKAFGPVVASER